MMRPHLESLTGFKLKRDHNTNINININRNINKNIKHAMLQLY